MIETFVAENDRLRLVGDLAAKGPGGLDRPSRGRRRTRRCRRAADRHGIPPARRWRRSRYPRASTEDGAFVGTDAAGACRRRQARNAARHLCSPATGWSPSATTSRAPSKPSRCAPRRQTSAVPWRHHPGLLLEATSTGWPMCSNAPAVRLSTYRIPFIRRRRRFRPHRNFQEILHRIGSKEDLVSEDPDSLLTAAPVRLPRQFRRRTGRRRSAAASRRCRAT